MFAPGTQVYWRVRPVDNPYPLSGGLVGLYSLPQVVTTNAPATAAGVWDNQAQVTGLKVALDGVTAAGSSGGCTTPNVTTICDNIPSTPVLSWDPVPGATGYFVYYAQDEDFTTTEIPAVPATYNTIFQLRAGDSKVALPDSQAGTAYYWHIRPCAGAGCGPDPESHVTLPDTRGFRKASPAVAGLSSSDPSANEITFSWQDYYDTNQARIWGSEVSNQAAQTYRIQVDNEPSFASPIDTRVVDQATVTAYDRLYPEGTYWWRVQAIDAQNQGLTWSPVASFTKSSPTVSLNSPVGGATVSGTTPFRWAAQAFAASYEVDVYRNNDLTFSAANRVFNATVKTVAYTPASPLPAASTPYLWRVRRIDATGNVGPWSNPQAFYSTGVAPNLLAPKAASWVPTGAGFFQWTEVPGAASYMLNIFNTKGNTSSKLATVATAYASAALPTGAYTWNVTAVDGVGQPLATSATRKFQVDATPPTVKKVTPAVWKPTSTIKVTFSERLKGISKKSIQLQKLKGEKYKKVDAKITSAKKGKVAKIDPKGRLRPGSYRILLKTTKLKDLHGNYLVANPIATALRGLNPVKGARNVEPVVHRHLPGSGTTP
jgi:hypothetical protein